jgi:hypothetical protein
MFASAVGVVTEYIKTGQVVSSKDKLAFKTWDSKPEGKRMWPWFSERQYLKRIGLGNRNHSRIGKRKQKEACVMKILLSSKSGGIFEFSKKQTRPLQGSEANMSYRGYNKHLKRTRGTTVPLPLPLAALAF